MARALGISAGFGKPTTRLSHWLDHVRSLFLRRKLYRETLNELSSLSNRDLADLGLNRSMLKRVAWQAAYER
ncbi:DUF1127 domain-containing protein [Thalassococcus sp. S3]|uniref:DUF1127 domain-containing protein n=1 Tax=Thalassococcus sp. S3 TaxID=2017482 RepID=UPI00102481B3|nr:DUF1127 domain-containing protein [Thalassococcus sp. S3]QBF31237.1 hypothetical protein CFI11_08405 [Thalassococcus sp. S3]